MATAKTNAAPVKREPFLKGKREGMDHLRLAIEPNKVVLRLLLETSGYIKDGGNSFHPSLIRRKNFATHTYTALLARKIA
jgi:hypothetical protein